MTRRADILASIGDDTDILVVSASVGAGHNQAAKAVLARLQADRPDICARWLDILTLASRPFRLYYSLGYALLVSYLPWFYGMGYKLTDLEHGPQRSLTERRRLLTERVSVGRYRRLVERVRPPVIFHTHFLAPPVIGRLPVEQRDVTRQVVAVTDYHLHRYWYSENIDRYFVPSAQGVDRLVDCGVSRASVELSGIPVHPRWNRPMDRDEMRRRWNLPVEGPVVTLTGGVDFTIGDISAMAHDLLSNGPENLRVVVLAGANKRLLASLAGSHHTGGGRLIALGFTDRNHEVAALSDLVITKSGGMTTTECLTVGRPMVLLPPLPGQEAANARHMQSLGAALTGDSPRDVVAMTLRLLKEPAVLRRMAAAAASAARPATATIAGYLAGLIDEHRSRR